MIKEALDAYANSLTKTWAHDRSKTVGASEIGQCARKTWYGKNTGPRDPDYVDDYGARIRGTIIEDQFWYPAMKMRFGENLFFAGPDQKTFVLGYLSATPDGLVVEEGRPAFTLECKTADPRTNLTSPKAEHIFQVHTQMGLIRNTTGYRVSHAILSYINASFWSEITEFKIAYDPDVYAVAKDRAATIMTATGATELKPEGWIAGGRECEHCAFTKACGITRRSVPKDNEAQPIDVQFTAEITDLARSIKALERVGETNDARLREAQQAIRDRLREKGIRRIPGVISWASVKGRKTYDNKRLQEAATEAGIDIEAYSKVSEDSDRLTITAAKEEA